MASEKKVKIEKKKEFTYRGKTLEELKSLDIREFAKLIPARERRTILRNTDVVEVFLSRSNKKIAKNKNVRTHNRAIVIIPAMVGMQIGIHNVRTQTWRICINSRISKTWSCRNWSYKIKCK